MRALLIKGYQLSMAAVMLGWSGASSAGIVPPGTITFAPGAAASVPTLGGVLLVLLAGLLAVIGIRAARQRRAPVLVAALATGAALSGGGGLQLVSPVDAGIGEIISKAEQQQFDLFEGTTLFENGTAVPMETVSIQATDEACRIEERVGKNPACQPGETLAPGGLCQVNLSCGLETLPNEPPLTDSDRRLKTDIQQIGITHNALPLYRYRYRGEDAVYEGVMAQDVLQHTPSAVVLGSDGFYAVDYSALGLTMRRVR